MHTVCSQTAITEKYTNDYFVVVFKSLNAQAALECVVLATPEKKGTNERSKQQNRNKEMHTYAAIALHCRGLLNYSYYYYTSFCNKMKETTVIIHQRTIQYEQ